MYDIQAMPNRTMKWAVSFVAALGFGFGVPVLAKRKKNNLGWVPEPNPRSALAFPKKPSCAVASRNGLTSALINLTGYM
eukprot:9486325-Pyramimonas_sp.AAC.1